MPLPISHGLFGASVVAALYPGKISPRLAAPLFAGAVVANLADLDFLLVFVTHWMKWHRGFTHSIAFAVLVLFLFLFFFGKERVREALAYSLAFASHFVLDFLTTRAAGGVELFFPFSRGRYAARWFGLSENPYDMTWAERFQAVLVEFALFFSLLAVILFLRKTFQKY
jgi:membrane-bound metal-dependent hydrolase YbcI (DUF457 family)